MLPALSARVFVLLLAATLRSLSSLTNRLGKPLVAAVMAEPVHYDLLVRGARALHSPARRP